MEGTLQTHTTEAVTTLWERPSLQPRKARAIATSTSSWFSYPVASLGTLLIHLQAGIAHCSSVRNVNINDGTYTTQNSGNPSSAARPGPWAPGPGWPCILILRLRHVTFLLYVRAQSLPPSCGRNDVTMEVTTNAHSEEEGQVEIRRSYGARFQARSSQHFALLPSYATPSWYAQACCYRCCFLVCSLLSLVGQILRIV